MTKITIEGLTAKQKILMDTLWSIESLDNVRAFVNSLPLRDQQDCLSLITILTQDTTEQEDTLDEYKAAAELCISSAMLR